MLSLNEIKTGQIIKLNDQPYLIIKTMHHKVARGGAVLKTKCRNLIDNSVLEKTFQGSDKAERASTETKKANFLYQDANEAIFMDNESYEQFNLSLENLGDKTKFLKENTDINVLYYNNQAVSIELPIKMDFKVISAPPGIKGNSAGNVNKTVEIETGATISVPMFINENDIIRINTENGEYVERAN